MVERICTFGIKEIDEAKFIKPFKSKQPDFRNKPEFGLWGSSLRFDTNNKKFTTAWLQWCENEQFHYPAGKIYGISYKLKPDAKIYELDSADKYFDDLIKRYCIKGYDQYSYIDFYNLSKDYDAFHITENCFYELRTAFYDVRFIDENYHQNIADFYAYDCESWIIFNIDIIDKESEEIVKTTVSRYY